MWRKITEDDLVATLSRMEVDAYREDFEADPVPKLLEETAAWARTFIRSNGNVRINPDESTLPASCVSPAMDYAAVKILKRLDVEPNEIRKQARQDAIAFFNQIAKGEVTPESHEASETESTGGPAVETVSCMRRRTDGIEGF